MASKTTRGLLLGAVLVLALGFCPTGEVMAGPQTASEVATDDKAAQRSRKLAEQKLKLLERMLAAPRMVEIEKGSDRAAAQAVERARIFAKAVRDSLAKGAVERAGKLLDSGLREISKAGRGGRPAGTKTDASAKALYDELTKGIETFQAALGAATGEARQATDKRMKTLLSAALVLGQRKRYRDANRLLNEAYQIAATAVSKARANQTVVYDLKFDTLGDEFIYERERYNSYVMLVRLKVGERGKDHPASKMAERFAAEARGISAQAESEATGKNFEPAIKTMEKATGRLVRALRALGLAVPN